MRPHPKRAQVDPGDPRAWATCDRTGFVVNHRDMVWQDQWAGFDLINLSLLVHRDYYDEPQPQLRALVIPPDPDPLFNARPEPYTIDEPPVTTRIAMDGRVRVAMQRRPQAIRILDTYGTHS